MGMGHLPPAPPAEHGPYTAAIHRQLPPQPAAAAAARTPLEQPGHYKRGPSASVTLIGLLTHVCSEWLFDMIAPWPGLDWIKYSTEQPAPRALKPPQRKQRCLLRCGIVNSGQMSLHAAGGQIKIIYQYNMSKKIK
jgi:hypothetical protein